MSIRTNGDKHLQFKFRNSVIIKINTFPIKLRFTKLKPVQKSNQTIQTIAIKVGSRAISFLFIMWTCSQWSPVPIILSEWPINVNKKIRALPAGGRIEICCCIFAGCIGKPMAGVHWLNEIFIQFLWRAMDN